MNMISISLTGKNNTQLKVYLSTSKSDTIEIRLGKLADADHYMMSFYDNTSREHLIDFLENRIGIFDLLKLTRRHCLFLRKDTKTIYYKYLKNIIHISELNSFPNYFYKDMKTNVDTKTLEKAILKFLLTKEEAKELEYSFS